jgi:hypothetical protein
MTPRIFSLEFIRQRVISETEHFLKAHKASNMKFPFVVGPVVVKRKSCLPQVQSKLNEFGFTQLQGRRYDPHQIIPKRRLASKQGPHEHEHVEELDKLANLETYTEMEVIMLHDQAKQTELALQQSSTQKPSPRLIIKALKMSIFNKRSSSEALGASSQQDTLKKMRVTSPSPIIDLEEEEQKERTGMEIVETAIQNEEINPENKPQNEGSMKVFSSRKHTFGQTTWTVYKSKEDLLHQYVVKGSMANSEIKDLLPKVEGTSQRKSSPTFSQRCREKDIQHCNGRQ